LFNSRFPQVFKAAHPQRMTPDNLGPGQSPSLFLGFREGIVACDQATAYFRVAVAAIFSEKRKDAARSSNVRRIDDPALVTPRFDKARPLQLAQVK
jgi:hypothetical protein